MCETCRKNLEESTVRAQELFSLLDGVSEGIPETLRLAHVEFGLEDPSPEDQENLEAFTRELNTLILAAVMLGKRIHSFHAYDGLRQSMIVETLNAAANALYQGNALACCEANKQHLQKLN